MSHRYEKNVPMKLTVGSAADVEIPTGASYFGKVFNVLRTVTFSFLTYLKQTMTSNESYMYL